MAEDQDFHAKQRIARWIDDNASLVVGEVDDHDVAKVLLAFWKYLNRCEEERQKS